MKGSVAARQAGTWLKWFWLLAALTIAIGLTLNARAIAGETGSVDEYGGVALANSVLLDPFDPVPEIHFRDRGCDWDGCRRDCYHRDCGEERFRCHDNCRWRGWACEHGCYDINRPRDGAYNVGWWRCADGCNNGDWWCDHDCHLEGWHCEHDCFIHEPGGRYGRRGEGPPLGDACPDVCYGRLIHEYEEALAHHAEQAHKYDEQSRWYFEHVIDYRPGFIERLFDWHRHDGPPPIPPGPPPPPGFHGPDGYGPPHGPDAYGPPGPPHGPDGYGPHGPPPGPGVVYGPGPAAGGYGYGPPSGPGPASYGPPRGPGYGPPPPGPGPVTYGPAVHSGTYGPPPGPMPASYGPPSGGPAGPPPGSSGPPPGATPPGPPPGAVATTPGPGPGDFGPPPH